MSPNSVCLTGLALSPSQVVAIARRGAKVEIEPEAMARMAASRQVVERYVAEDRPAYGLTTGLGSRVTHRLSVEDMAAFSRRTIVGRSVALGPPLEDEVVRGLMTVRLNGLLSGGSGAAPSVAEHLLALLNGGVHPVIPGIGSIGAGDLCIMAHLGLALIGQGEMTHGGATLPAADGLSKAGLAPLELGPKDGLAICNASSYSAARAALALADAEDALALAQATASLTLEGFRANLSPLDPRAIAARPQPGQAWAAEDLGRLLGNSLLFEPGQARRVQDPLSLRCLPQVHGSLRAVLDFLAPSVDAELNGTADNPLVSIEDDEILSTGNFQTPLLGLALDSLTQALGQIAGMSLNRSGRLLIERLSGLPANLSPKGLGSSGFAPLLKAGEALLAEIRHLGYPVPQENRWGADGVEDEITNAPLAARKAQDTIWRLRLLLAIELSIAAQAVELAAPARIGSGPEIILRKVREVMPPLDEDRTLSAEIQGLEHDLLSSGRLLAALS